MNITSAKYMNSTNLKAGTTNKDTIKATIDNEEMFVPLDENTRHYQAIQEWGKKGNKIEEAD